MFCSSLRKRKEWTGIPGILLSHQQPKWDERSLQGHDIAIPLPTGSRQQELFRILLLSQTEINDENLQRVERLYHQQGGRHVGVVFLLPVDHKGITAFMNLQISLLSKIDIPILTLSSLTSLPTTLTTFQRQLVSTRSSALTSIPNSVTELLPFCTTSPPLPEHAKNILSDICRGIPSLAEAATTHEGQRGLRDWLQDTPGAADDLIAFWEQEFIAE